LGQGDGGVGGETHGQTRISRRIKGSAQRFGKNGRWAEPEILLAYSEHKVHDFTFSRSAMSHILPPVVVIRERADNPSLGTYLQITPAIHHAIQLNTRRPRFVNDPKHGAVIQMQSMGLCPYTDVHAVLEEASGHANFTITYPGLEAAIIVMLQAVGVHVQTQRRELLPLASPDLSQLAAFDVVDTQFLDFIHQHDRGLVHYGPGVNPAVLAAQVALAFPAADIVLPLATMSRMHSVADPLEPWLPDVQRLGRHDSVDIPVTTGRSSWAACTKRRKGRWCRRSATARSATPRPDGRRRFPRHGRSTGMHGLRCCGTG